MNEQLQSKQYITFIWFYFNWALNANDKLYLLMAPSNMPVTTKQRELVNLYYLYQNAMKWMLWNGKVVQKKPHCDHPKKKIFGYLLTTVYFIQCLSDLKLPRHAGCLYHNTNSGSTWKHQNGNQDDFKTIVINSLSQQRFAQSIPVNVYEKGVVSAALDQLQSCPPSTLRQNRGQQDLTSHVRGKHIFANIWGGTHKREIQHSCSHEQETAGLAKNFNCVNVYIFQGTNRNDSNYTCEHVNMKSVCCTNDNLIVSGATRLGQREPGNTYIMSYVS